ncbi:endonuclease domain-containing protein [Sphingomonas suaedae]|uniref:Endonuclease domain-containing protein n=1 Tax=Sphingomonas suaedae TaxID=2599297 RepID=A0A518RDE5_9SPHN|nr:endonuclease domain-containing protein [Sphingomonas suaedae]QDX25480.1 endonuclease domain-containing protein [Sphingomonas suaedae]
MASDRELGEFARQMRRNPTEWEKRLWRHLSNRQLAGHKFRRQHKFAPYIADFFCPAKGLVVELDGDTHRADRDEARDIFFLRSGFTTLRFTNAEVHENIDGVLQAILSKLAVNGATPSPVFRERIRHASPSTAPAASASSS